MKRKSPLKKILISVTALILVAAVGLGIWKYTGSGKAEPVNVFEFNYVGMTEYWGDSQESYGFVQTDKIQTVFLSSTQTVTEIFVAVGDEVKKGDVLMTFDTTLSDLSLERKRLDVEKLKLQLQDAKRRLIEINSMKPMVIPEIPDEDAEVDLGTALSGNCQISSNSTYDGSTVEKALICWISGDTSIDEDILDALILTAEAYQIKNAQQPPSSASAVGASEPDGNGGTGDSTQESTGDSTQESTRDSTQESTGDSTQESTGDSTQEGTGDSTQESTGDSTQESTGDSTQESTGDSTQESTDDSTQESTGDSTGETTVPPTTETTAPPTTETTVPPTTEVPPETTVPPATEAPTEPTTEPTEPTEPPLEVSISQFYVVFKVTEGNMSLGSRLTWQGMLVNRDPFTGKYSMRFFDASAVQDHMLSPEEAENQVPEIDYGSGFTAAQIAQMRSEQQKTIKDLEFGIKMAEAEYKIMQTEVSDGKVYAQIDGTVVSLLPAEEAQLNQQPLLKVSGGGGFYIEGSISELEKENMALGQEVTINDWNTGMTYVGTVQSMGDYPSSDNYWTGMGNPTTTYYPFKVFVDETADLQEGNYVNITYSAGTSEHGVYLQNPFLRTEGGRSFVYVQGADGKLEQRYVTTGKSLWGSYTEILDGLSETDYVAFPYGKDVKAGAETVQADISELYE